MTCDTEEASSDAGASPEAPPAEAQARAQVRRRRQFAMRPMATRVMRLVFATLLVSVSLMSLHSASGPPAIAPDQPRTLVDGSAYQVETPPAGASAPTTPPTAAERDRALLSAPPLPSATAEVEPDATRAATQQPDLQSTPAVPPCITAACTTPTPDAQPTAQPQVTPPGNTDSDGENEDHGEVRDMLDDDTRDTMRARAHASWDALQLAFFDADMQQYREVAYGGGWPPYAYLWPLSQVVAAGNDLISVPHDKHSAQDRRGTVIELLALTERYFDEDGDPAGYSSYLLPPYGAGGDRYYDDNVWLGLELVRAYELTGHPVALERAQQVLAFMLSGWDTDPVHYAMGGIAWIENENNGNRNTVSTAPAIELALRLYQHTDDDDQRTLYWSWATRMYAWLTETLQAPSGMFYDHVRADGIIDTTLHSYNQGAMIGANLAMYTVSGEQQYLDRAVRLADTSVTWFRNGGRDDQPIAFNALYFRRLLELNSVQPHQEWLDLVVREADLLWNTARDEDSDLLTTSAPLTLLDQAAGVEIFAMLAGYGDTPHDDARASTP